jgi:hypothetical protein
MAAPPIPVKFGAKAINPGTGRLVQQHNKGSQQYLLPNRHAVAELTKGDPWQRSIGNYAKLTPSGANAPMSYQTIIDMGNLGVNMKE